MNIKRNIIFALENRKNDGKPIIENVPIRMRVIFSGKRIEFTTGYRIDAEKWDNEKQKVKNGCTNKLKQSASEINSSLLKYYAEIQDIFKEFEVKEIIPTPSQIKLTFNQKHKHNGLSISLQDKLAKVSLFTAFDEFHTECSIQNNWTASTKRRFLSLKRLLKDFDENITFESLDEDKLNDFFDYLQNVKSFRNATITKEIKQLKWFLRWSVKKGYNENQAFALYKPKLKNLQKKIIFLTWKELNQLRNFSIPESKNHLDRVRDVFLFCCFTGLRHSDAFNLKRSDVKNNHIEITTIKTSDSLVIELNNHSKNILDKYKDIVFEGNRALPVISNQKMNEYLKELGELAEINEPVRETYYQGNQRIDEVTPKYALLGTHAGRRTFICNALSLGIPPQVVMKWTGHSDYKAMKPYIDIADEVKVNAMDKFNQL
jgi:integrase